MNTSMFLWLPLCFCFYNGSAGARGKRKEEWIGLVNQARAEFVTIIYLRYFLVGQKQLEKKEHVFYFTKQSPTSQVEIFVYSPWTVRHFYFILLGEPGTAFATNIGLIKSSWMLSRLGMNCPVSNLHHGWYINSIVRPASSSPLDSIILTLHSDSVKLEARFSRVPLD